MSEHAFLAFAFTRSGVEAPVPDKGVVDRGFMVRDAISSVICFASQRRYIAIAVLLHVLMLWQWAPQPAATISNFVNASSPIDTQWSAVTVSLISPPVTAKKQLEQKSETDKEPSISPMEKSPMENVMDSAELKTLTDVKEKTPTEPFEKTQATENVQSSETPQQETAPEIVMQKESPPQWIDRPAFAMTPVQPDYPVLARKRMQEGTVWLEIWIDAQGMQTRLELLKGSGFDLLDDAARSAAAQWLFQPHRDNNQAIAARIRVPIKFSIQ